MELLFNGILFETGQYLYVNVELISIFNIWTVLMYEVGS